MPLLYGEGDRAFLRLQEEKEAVMTNKGLRIHTSSIFTTEGPLPFLVNSETFCLYLGCMTRGRSAYVLICYIAGSFVRVHPDLNTDDTGILVVGKRMKPWIIHLLSYQSTGGYNMILSGVNLVVLLEGREKKTSLELLDVWPRGLFDISSGTSPVVLVEEFRSFVGYIELSPRADFEDIEMPDLIVIMHRLPGMGMDTPPTIHLLLRDEAAHILSLRERTEDIDPVITEQKLIEGFDPSLLPSWPNSTSMLGEGRCKLLLQGVEEGRVPLSVIAYLVYEPTHRRLRIVLRRGEF